MTQTTRRQRVEFRMAGTAVVVNEVDSPVGETFHIWTVNLSRTGALLIADQEVQLEERVLFKLHSPVLGQKLALGKVVRADRHEELHLNGTRTLHKYGVRILLFLTASDLCEDTLRAFAEDRLRRRRFVDAESASEVGSAVDAVTTADTKSDSNAPKSLLPLLSAVGLTVVHLSSFAW